MIDQDFNFHDLFILDLANNHQGSVEHGLGIIQSMAEVVNRHQVRAAIKFQFRQLDTFIHTGSSVKQRTQIHPTISIHPIGPGPISNIAQ